MRNSMKQLHKFPPLGLTYFWCLNDYCDDGMTDQQIEEFSRARITTVCLHPRDGLLLPYGSSDWFEFIRRTALKLAAKGIEIWLYDEDPYPSGNAGGRIVLDHPEFIARKIVMYQASPDEIKEDGLWIFPAKGKLLLCALLSGEDSELIEDKTGNVGMVRRDWKMLKSWDSRWYYPATPLHISDRAIADSTEYAIKTGKIPDGQKLAAFTVEAIEDERWGYYADSLNPLATEKFIEYTHEKYLQCAGDMFGNQITAIFTDEPKFHCPTPWTHGLLDDFKTAYGYDLRLRLFDLFSNLESPQSIRTRLHYREWCGRRFERSWLEPVAAWCRSHRLKLIGHMSPEDDPVTQSLYLSNLMPLQKHMSLAGLDLIIPAVGDKNHPMINVGIVSAASSAQQHGQPGVMSELLACSGNDFTIEQAYKILNWQTVMGMTTPVIHAIFHSLREEREFECPPDFSPWSKFGDGLRKFAEELKPVQEILLGATQIAPVAILWPIKSFHMLNLPWQAEPGGLREELTGLLLKCLEFHVGIHFLDEADFQRAVLEEGILRIGKAAYSHVIVPGSTVWSGKTWDLLVKYSGEKLHVYQYGTSPRYLENMTEVEHIDMHPFKMLTPVNIKTELPALMKVSSGDAENIRVSGWMKDGCKYYLFCYLGDGVISAETNNESLELSGNKITIIMGAQTEVCIRSKKVKCPGRARPSRISGAACISGSCPLNLTILS